MVKKKINIYRMKKIQTFEQFSTNEMFMTGIPTNPKTGKTIDLLGGIDDMNKDMKELFGNSFKQATEKLNVAIDGLLAEVDGEKLLEAVENYFGVPANKITYSLVKSKLESQNESVNIKNNSKNRSTTEKVLRTLQMIFLYNIGSFGTLFAMISWLVDKAVDIGGMADLTTSFVTSIVAFIVVTIVRALVSNEGSNTPNKRPVVTPAPQPRREI
jgi:hypothetical protein